MYSPFGPGVSRPIARACTICVSFTFAGTRSARRSGSDARPPTESADALRKMRKRTSWSISAHRRVGRCGPLPSEQERADERPATDDGDGGGTAALQQRERRDDERDVEHDRRSALQQRTGEDHREPDRHPRGDGPHAGEGRDRERLVGDPAEERGEERRDDRRGKHHAGDRDDDAARPRDPPPEQPGERDLVDARAQLRQGPRLGELAQADPPAPLDEHATDHEQGARSAAERLRADVEPRATERARARRALQYVRPRCRAMSKRAVFATAITAITPAWTGSVTTRSAARGTDPAMFRLITRMPFARTSSTAALISPPMSAPASTSATARGSRATARTASDRSRSPTIGIVSMLIFSPRMLWRSASEIAPSATCPTCAPPPTTMIRLP